MSDSAECLRLQFARLLIKLAGDLIDGNESVQRVISRIEHCKSENVRQAIVRFADIPSDSPVNDALQITSKDVNRDRQLFKKLAQERLASFQVALSAIEEMAKYYPTIEQREYVIDYMLDSVMNVKEYYEKINPQQIKFEMPSE